MVTRAGAGPPSRGGADPVELAVSEIRHLARKAALDLALEVGEIVFRHVFEADLDLVKDQGVKHASFRRLALHPDLPMSASSLWRSVATFELFQRQPWLRECKHVGATHVQAVLGLPPRDQERLLGRAERERLKATDLREQAAARRKGAGGRPPKLQILKALDSLRRVAGLPLSTFADPGTIRRMGSENVELALTTLDELEERIAAFRAALRAGAARS